MNKKDNFFEDLSMYPSAAAPPKLFALSMWVMSGQQKFLFNI